MPPSFTINAALNRPWWQAARTLVFPEGCLVCGGRPETEHFCEPCRADLQKCQGPQCVRCALIWDPVTAGFGPEVPCPHCRKRLPPFDEALAIGIYEGPLRSLCLRIKSRHGAWLAPRLIDVLVNSHHQVFERWMTNAAAAGLPPLVVPVPLHWTRRWWRGYNQAEALAQAIAGRLDLTLGKPLRRIQRTRKLAPLTRTERQVELKDAFRVQPWSRHPVAGRDVILVDDILTTGATCNTAARALKRGGARKVYTVVLARAKDPR